MTALTKILETSAPETKPCPDNLEPQGMKCNFSQAPLEVPDPWTKKISGRRAWVRKKTAFSVDFLAESLESQSSQFEAFISTIE